MKKIHSEGDVIGKLLFVKEVEPGSRKRRMAIFKCPVCNKEFITGINESKSRNTKSCGCHLHLNAHRLTTTSIYHVWAAMKQRCFNEKETAFYYYGARGITIAEEFKKFLTWYEYVKQLPNYEFRESLKLTLDRIDNNKGYERGNLRWITMAEQSKNKRPQTKKNTMTNQQVIEELKKLTKPYQGVMAQSSFSNKMRDIKNDLSKPSTVKVFFEKFGYTGSWNNWVKVSVNA